MQLFAAILGILFVVAFVFERWATRNWARRDQIGKTRTQQWWQEPPGDGPEGDH